jgi:hypothetical protein
MPFIKKTTNKIQSVQTGGDFNNPSPVLKDVLKIVTAAEETSKVMSTGFQYTVGINALEVYVNGHLKRCIETLDGTDYGDYEETSNGSVTFQAGVIQEGWQVRFRVTANSYDYSSDNRNNLEQLSRTVYGRESSDMLRGSAVGYGVTEVNVLAYGQELNDVTLQAAINGIGTDSRTLVLSVGTWDLEADVIVPANICLRVPNGALIEIATGKTLTINGSFEAGLYQVFDCVGTGEVLLPGTVTVITQWFGESGRYKSIGTAVYVDEVVINKAIIAAGDCGTIEFLGDYYIGAGLTMGVTQKWYGRHSPRVGGPAGFAYLKFSINSGAGITTNGNSVLENLRISTLGGTSIGVLSDSNGINATNLNISGSNIAMSLKQNWYSTIRNCHFSYLTISGLGIKIDYCYDLIIDRVIIHALQTMILSNSSNVHVSNSCFEGQGAVGIDVGIGCQISITDTYFESGYDGSILIHIRNSSRISVVNSHVYMTNCYRFLNASGSTNVSIFSRNNYFRYPAIGDTTARYVYYAPSSGQVDIEGDNWEATDPAVLYFSGSLPQLNYRVIYPNNHPTPYTYLQEGGARGLRAVRTNGIVNTFVCANNKDTVINNTLVTTSSLIFLSPNNAAAAALQAGASAIFPIDRVAGTHFTVRTADGNPAAGTENFVYFIIN